MPNFKRKSCTACRSAKAACNRETPRCSRCVSKGLTCHRPFSNDQRSTMLRDIRSAASPCRQAAIESIPDHVQNFQDFFVGSDWPEILGSEDASYIGPNDMNFAFNQQQENSERTEETATPSIEDLDWSIIPAGPACVGNNLTLRLRQSSGFETRMASQILLGRINRYPSLFLEGLSLPPFIHPPCLGNDATCYNANSHQCLPESLAICASLTRMFYTQTPGVKRYLWRSIYFEQSRLLSAYKSYQKEEVLFAVQALAIYLVLQASDPSSIPENNATELIVTIEKMVCSILPYGYTSLLELAGNIPTREEWVFFESLRRTTAFLYIVSAVFNTDTPAAHASDCEGCSLIPLPSQRCLWEATSNAEWQREYRYFLTNKRKSQPLTLGLLKEPAKTMEPALPTGELADELSKWCLEQDEFGTTVWLARDFYQR